MGLERRVLKWRLAIWFRIGTVLSISLLYIVIGFASRGYQRHARIDQAVEDFDRGGGRKLLSLVPRYNCTPSAINDFPSDGLTREQRQHGWAIIHILLACYFFMLMGLVCEVYFVPAVKSICTMCEVYFVPAVKSICTNLHMREDVTGATFMAVAGSSSELFINGVGTFITEGDIGVGTVNYLSTAWEPL
ncbi:Sodium/calcium exchanger protein [Popillia japonica]|uniref:Sodium/calcium exchanger protein n=1 Tax=Popillia japonica TaxID=7064 RepID=A0AAW1L678_POPJA